MRTLNVILFFLLTFGSTAIAAEVKPPAILLQEGIYAEETEGNLDKAMEIYSQIRQKYNDVERIAARATYQLGLCHLKKGDNKKAAELFDEVVGYYPQQTEAVKMAQGQLDKLGIKKAGEGNLFEILGQVNTYIGSKYGEICAEAGYNKLYSNSHIYVVDKDFVLRNGGMGYVYNWTDKPITEKYRISGTSYPNQKLYDVIGNPIDVEILPDEKHSSFYNIYWTPKEPLQPGGFFNFGWAMDGSEPLLKTEQGYQLKMHNHFGDHCYETFFLVVPEGTVISSQSEDYTNKGTLNGWDIYWWKKEVPQDTDHTVSVVLSDKAVKSLRPVVIKTSPENFANNVSPDVNQITITFDRKMLTSGYSWCQNNNETFPQTTGKPYFSSDTLSCTLPVKLKAGQYYRIGINTPPFVGFKSTDGQISQEFIFIFATADANGNPTVISENLIAEAKNINSTQTKSPCRQVSYYEIDPNGTIYFKSPLKYTNESTTPMTTTSFNTDMNVTGIYDKAEQPIKSTVTQEGNHFRYDITFNKPVLPDETIEGTIAGTIAGQIKPVAAMKDTYQYYMRHWPEAGQPTLITNTFLLPKGAELISTIPPNMTQKEKDGRIELFVEELIPADGSITTAFQYRLSGANIKVSGQELNTLVQKAVLAISTCAETDPKIAESLNSLKGLDQNSVVSQIVKYLDDPIANVRRSAVFILLKGKFDNIAPAEDKLLKLCKHEENFTRGMAAIALGAAKISSSFETLKDMTLNDKDGYARRCAAYALGLYGDKEALPVLEKALQDEDPLVKNNAQAAITMLTKLNDPNLK